MNDAPLAIPLTPVSSDKIALKLRWSNAAPPVPAAAAEFIAARWAIYSQQAQAAGKSLYDGRIAQLVHVGHAQRGGMLQVTLDLALGSYKDFVVTCLRDWPWLQANAGEFCVAALGNSALVTRGSRALFGRRSPKVSCYAGRLHMIGGVLEALGTQQFPASVDGLVAHLMLELQEEIGLAGSELTQDSMPRVLGLARDEFLHQPELFWQWEVGVELEDLLARMNIEEHTGGVIVERGRMTEELWEQLTPVARLAWERWAG